MHRSKTHLFIAVFIYGAALFSLESVSWFLFLTFVLLFRARKERLLLLVLVLIALALANVRVLLFESQPEREQITFGSEVSFEAVVISEVEKKERSSTFIVRADTYGNIFVVSDRYTSVSYGDALLLRGTLKEPEPFPTSNGRLFPYQKFLEKDHIYSILLFPDVEHLSKGNGNPVKQILFSVKRQWLSEVSRQIPNPHAALAGGLVVGAESSLGESLEEAFRKTGIIHIVVLSGYNVTIVAESLMRFLSFLPLIARLSFGAVSIILFAILTGASATIVRASIMALLVLLARATGRVNEITHALFITAFFMVLHNPYIVLYDPSFQLSFLATLGLIHVSPKIEKFLTFVPRKWQLRDFAAATIGTQLFVLPLLIYMVGDVSLVSVPVNVLILPFIPLTMLFGFLSGVLGLVSDVLAFPFSTLSYLLLSYELSIVEMFASLPFASIELPKISIWAVIILYVVAGYVLYKQKASQREAPVTY